MVTSLPASARLTPLLFGHICHYLRWEVLRARREIVVDILDDSRAVTTFRSSTERAIHRLLPCGWRIPTTAPKHAGNGSRHGVVGPDSPQNHSNTPACRRCLDLMKAMWRSATAFGPRPYAAP